MRVEQTFNPYIPILAMLALSVGFVVFSLITNALAGPKRYNRAKLDAYECGIEPTPHAAGGGRFPVKYYLVAMTFIVFDVEVVFLYPWAVAFERAARLRARRDARLPVHASPCRSSTSGAGAAWSGTDRRPPRAHLRAPTRRRA